jgi:hypothetical protein
MTIEVAFSSGGSRGEVPGKETKVEARERRENTIFKGKVEGCARWRTKHGMVKGHEVKRRTDRVNVAEKTRGERKVRRSKVQRGVRWGRNDPEIRRCARASQEGSRVVHSGDMDEMTGEDGAKTMIAKHGNRKEGMRELGEEERSARLRRELRERQLTNVTAKNAGAVG